MHLRNILKESVSSQFVLMFDIVINSDYTRQNDNSYNYTVYSLQTSTFHAISKQSNPNIAIKFYSSIDFNRVWSDPSTNDRAKTTSTLFRGRVSVVWMFQAALEKQAGLRKQVASSQEFLCFCSSTSARHLHQQILSQGQKLIQNTPNVIIKTGNCFFFEGPLAPLCW